MTQTPTHEISDYNDCNYCGHEWKGHDDLIYCPLCRWPRNKPVFGNPILGDKPLRQAYLGKLNK